MSDRTLAEIIAEGKKLTDREGFHGNHELGRFFWQHGPRLLAVAEAAVRYTDALDDYDHTDDGDFVQQRALLTQTEAALRAAVRGEEKTNG